MGLILVGVGTGVGAMCRLFLNEYFKTRTKYPLSTLIVNVLGAFILGIVIQFNNTDVKLLLGDGFCGGFTTFSAFAFESFYGMTFSKKIDTSIYIGTTLVLGFFGFYIGNAVF